MEENHTGNSRRVIPKRGNNNKQNTKTRGQYENQGISTRTRLPKIRIQYRMHNRTKCKQIHRQHTRTIPRQHNNSTQDDRTIRHYANNKIQRHKGVKPSTGCNKPERKHKQDQHTINTRNYKNRKTGKNNSIASKQLLF